MDDRDTTNGEQSPDVVESPNSLYQEALTETRRVIDAQVEMIENTEDEILMIMRLNIIALGGVVTLLTYIPDLVATALPWVAVSSLLIISSILISGFIYRGVTLYAGFGDHGHDDHIPRQKIPYGDLVRTSEDASVEGHNGQLPSREEFFSALLNEHQSGISHNNVEIKYRSQIHQQAILLLLSGVLLLGIGLVTGISNAESVYVLGSLAIATSLMVAGAGYTLVKSIGLIGRFIQTNADPSRLSYGYAFERQYPYLSRLCLFILMYVYDPEHGEW